MPAGQHSGTLSFTPSGQNKNECGIEGDRAHKLTVRRGVGGARTRPALNSAGEMLPSLFLSNALKACCGVTLCFLNVVRRSLITSELGGKGGYWP